MEKRNVEMKVRMMYQSTRPSQGRYGFFITGGGVLRSGASVCST